MKILAVRGANLASLERPFSLNFREEPLRSAGLYAIVGPTGAGKSTILDAICLALFDRVPRLQHTKESGAQVLDISGERISSFDSRVLLRKGAVEGYAEVEFLGKDGVEYLARWEVRRAARRQCGRLQSVRLSLSDISTGKLIAAEGKGECLALISEKLGLGFEQFTRSVLLAQGDFAKFLQAKTGEKAALLERLTNSEEFAHISSSIFLLNRKAQQELQFVERDLSALQAVPDEQLSVWYLELESKNVDLQQLHEQWRTTTLLADQLQRYLLQCQAVRDAERDVEVLSNQFKQFEPDLFLLDCWDEAQGIYHHLIHYRQLSSSCTVLGVEYERLNDEMHSLQLIKLEAVEQMKICQDKLCDLRKEKEALEHALAEADVIERTISNLSVIIQERTDEWQLYDTKYKDLISQLDGLECTLQELRVAHAHDKHAIAVIDSEQCAILDDAQVIDLLENYSFHYHACLEHQSHIQRIEQNLSYIHHKEEQCKRDIQDILGSIDPLVLSLRKELQAGKPCPVCGSLHHPNASQVDISTIAHSEQNQRISDLSKKLEDLAFQGEKLHEERVKRLGSLEQCMLDQERQRTRINSVASIAGIHWEHKLVEQPDWVENLRTAYNQRMFLSQQLQSNEIEQANCLTLLNSLNEQKRESEATCMTILQRLKALHDQLAAEQSHLFQLLKGKTSIELKADFQRRVTAMTHVADESNDRVNQIDAKLNAAIGQSEQLKVQLEQVRLQQHQLHTQINAWLSSRPHIGSEYSLFNLLEISSEDIKTKRSVIEQAKNESLLAVKLLDERRMQLASYDAETLERYTPKLLNDQIEELQSRINHTQNHLETLRLRIAQEEEVRNQLKDLEVQLLDKRENAQHWQRLNDLYGSADGARFRIMAQYYTLETLLRYANQHLAYIMPRYRIELMPSLPDATKRNLALQIIDTELLNESRPADTLSGGETFLVSLALSLALSAFTSSAYSIESLFIDEGFGSLDPESLEVALTALERLQTQGRKVGLISHVQEMNERIAVKIQVRKLGGGRSAVEVDRVPYSS